MGKPPRWHKIDYRGRISALITACTHDGHNAFADDAVCTMADSELRTTGDTWKIEITAYCFMPDHVHLLLTGVAEDSDLRAFMRTWKQSTGYWYPRERARPLWQGNYRDDVLREPEQIPFSIAYIVRNPVAAGLVGHAADYRWLGSTRYTKNELIEIAESICPG